MNRLLPVLLVAFVTGLILSPNLPAKANPWIVFGLVLALLAAFLFISQLNLKGRIHKIHTILSCAIFLSIGLLYPEPFAPHDNKPSELLALADGKAIRLAGILVKMPVFAKDKTELLIQVEQCLLADGIAQTLEGHVLVYLKNRPLHQLSCGDRVLWMGALHPVSNFRNPGCFDFERHMALKDVYVTSWVSDPHLLCVIGHAKFYFSETIENVRFRIQTFFDGHTPPPYSSLLKALVIGEMGDIPKEIQEAFARAGVSHILSISGLHMAIVAWSTYFVILWLIKRFPYLLLRFNAFKISAFLSVPLVLFYGAVSGLSAPSLRSVIMMMVVLTAICFKRQWDLYNNLAIAMWVILLSAPDMLYDPSFQLTFLAVLSIVLFYNPLNDYLSTKMHKPLARLQSQRFSIMKKAWEPMLVSVIVTLGTAPVIAYHFGRISLIGVLANVLVVPLMGTLVLALSLISVSLIPISLSLAAVFAQVAAFALDIALGIVRFCSSFAISSVSVARPYLSEIFLFYAGILLITMGFYRKHHVLLASLCLITIFLIEGMSLCQRNCSNLLRITFLDVGQGNAACVELPGGKCILIDGGGITNSGFDMGARVIAPFLRVRRINKLDSIILTHPHPDHVGGLGYLLENFGADLVFTNGDIIPGYDLLNPEGRTLQGGVSYQEIKADQKVRLKIGEVDIDVQGPASNYNGIKGSDAFFNNRSLIIRISHGKRHFLLPGDIETLREEQLLRTGYDPKADILLAPHHGSKTSSSQPFVNAVSPQSVIISTGRLNPFGFPNRCVLERYKSLGCSIFRTDLDGAITCKTDGEALEISTYAGQVQTAL